MGETEQRAAGRPSGRRVARGPLALPRHLLSRNRLATLWRWLVGTVKVVLIALVALYTAVFMIGSARFVVTATWMLFLVFYAICLVVHELGHAAAARAMGWRVHLIAVWRFAYAPRRGRFLRVARRGRGPDVGGWVNATPPPGMAWTHGVIPFILGGAGGNVALAVAASVAALALREADGRAFAGLIGLAGTSMIFAVASLVPVRLAHGGRNDGGLLIDALKHGEPPLRLQRHARLAGMIHDGVPAERWDESALRDLAEDPSADPDDVDPLLLDYALAVADLEGARRVLERYVGANPDRSVHYRCTYAFVIAMVDRDGTRAAEILDAVPEEAARKTFGFWRATAATAHLLGRRDETLAAIAEIRRIAPRLSARPDADDEAVFRAVERGEELPRLTPRGRVPGG